MFDDIIEAIMALILMLLGAAVGFVFIGIGIAAGFHVFKIIMVNYF